MWPVYSAPGVVWWRVSCSTLYSEGCTAVGGGSHTIAGTASVESFMDSRGTRMKGRAGQSERAENVADSNYQILDAHFTI